MFLIVQYMEKFERERESTSVLLESNEQVACSAASEFKKKNTPIDSRECKTLILNNGNTVCEKETKRDSGLEKFSNISESHMITISPTKKILYTTGEYRTGCVFCGYGAHLDKDFNKYQRLQITHPKQWEYCIRPKEENGLGFGEVLDYVGIDYTAPDMKMR